MAQIECWLGIHDWLVTEEYTDARGDVTYANKICRRCKELVFDLEDRRIRLERMKEVNKKRAVEDAILKKEFYRDLALYKKANS